MRDRIIPISVTWIGKDELQAIKRVLLSRWLGQGPEVEEFERRFAKYIGTKSAVAVSSGTAALHLALLACDIGPEDEVIVPTFTYVATANAVLHAGARPIFVDLNPHTYSIDPIGVKKALTRRTKAVIPVHYAGQPAEMNEIIEVAAESGLILIEDSLGICRPDGEFQAAWLQRTMRFDGLMVSLTGLSQYHQ